MEKEKDVSVSRWERLFSSLEGDRISRFFDWLKGTKDHPVRSLLIQGAFFLLVSFVALSLLSVTTTYIYDTIPTIFTDSNFFQEVGRMIIAGKKPYRDIFDHKGIYFFWYEAFCALFPSPLNGFFVMEVLIYAISLFCLFHILKEINLSSATIWSGLLFFLFFTCFVREGNLTEDFSLLFLFPSFYLYVRATKRNDRKTFLLANAITGMSAGILLFTRANNTAILFFAVIFYAVKTIRDKEFKDLAFNFLACLFPFALFCLIPILVSYAGGYLHDMLWQTFLMNAEYSTDHFDAERIILMTIDILSTVGFSIMLLRFRKKELFDKDVLLLFLIDMIGTGCIFAYTSHYPHYYIVTYPLLVTVISLAIEWLLQRKAADSAMKVPRRVLFVTRAIIPLALLANFLYCCSGYYSFLPDGQRKKLVMEEIIDHIEETDKEDGEEGDILAIDVNSAFYLLTDRLPQERHFAFQTWQNMTDPRVYVELEDYIHFQRPEWIVIDDTMPFYFMTIDDENMLKRENFLDKLVSTYGYWYESFSKGAWGTDRVVEVDGQEISVLSKERGLGVFHYVPKAIPTK